MKKNYFFVVSIILLALTLWAFSDNLVTDVGQESNSDPKFIIHGLFCLAWMVFLVVQTRFIKQGDYKTHERVGKAGMIAAIGVFVTTIYVFVAVFKGWDAMAPEAIANRFFMPAYGVCIALAYINRKKAAYHKRLIFIASFYMLGPIVSRAIGRWPQLNELLASDLSYGIVMLGTWTAFFISLFFYDRSVIKKLHPVSIIGFAVYCVVWVISFTV